MARVLYLTRNGLLEPLGQSQILAYLRALAGDHAISLITREKPEHWTDPKAMSDARAECDQLGISWQPAAFASGPKGIAPATDVAQMVRACRREVLSGRADLIHARSYLPALAARLAKAVSGAPFIFDMRALWPEELIAAGRLRRGSLTHRAIQRIERACLREAAGVVSLTEAAARHLRRAYPAELDGKDIAVIPTCADLDRFCPPQTAVDRPRVYGCIGTILSGWFRTDWLAAVFEAAASRDPSAQFEVVTRDDGTAVRQCIDPQARLGSRLNIFARQPHDMPDVIRGHDVSVMFFTDGLSKLGSSPTRLGEALGCGVPVIANDGVGDVASVVRDRSVGVLAAGPSRQQMSAALDALDALMADPALAKRCRRTAEEIYALDRGVAAYDRLYRTALAAAGGASP